MDGGFYLSTVLEQHAWEMGRSSEINVRALRNYIQSFGALQKFIFVREEVENKVKSPSYSAIGLF